MGFELIELDRTTLYCSALLRKAPNATATEEKYIKKICKDHKARRTTLYALVNASEGDRFYALLALSIGQKFNGLPSAAIDYLLVFEPYRKQKYKVLKHQKISEYLIQFSIRFALEHKQTHSLKYLVLEAAHEKLVPLYEATGFTLLEPERKDRLWMVQNL